MTLSTPWQPLAQFQVGEVVKHPKTGQALGGCFAARIYGVDNGPHAGGVCLIWRTPSMPVPAFTYHDTLLSAWAQFKRFRQRAGAA